MEEEKSINIGKMGRITFEEAYYAYVGSAMAGVHRLKRHLINLKIKNIKNKHWHIDFIIPHCKFIEWFFAESSKPSKEEELAISLSKRLDYIEGFGASDSRALSHLFKDSELRQLKREVIKALKFIELKNFQPKNFPECKEFTEISEVF